MFTTISRERRELRQAKIFSPKVTIIECAPGFRCPRCNKEVSKVFDLHDAGRGYFCRWCLLEFFDAIQRVAGFRARF
jgi:transcription elongation factor Elf1